MGTLTVDVVEGTSITFGTGGLVPGVVYLGNFDATSGTAIIDQDVILSENHLAGVVTVGPDNHYVKIDFVADGITEDPEYFTIHWSGTGVGNGTKYSGDDTFTYVIHDTECFIDVDQNGLESDAEKALTNARGRLQDLNFKASDLLEKIDLATDELDTLSDQRLALTALATLGVLGEIVNLGSLIAAPLATGVSNIVTAALGLGGAAVGAATAESVAGYVAAAASAGETLIKVLPWVSQAARAYDNFNTINDANTDAIRVANAIRTVHENIAEYSRQFAEADAKMEALSSCLEGSTNREIAAGALGADPTATFSDPGYRLIEGDDEANDLTIAATQSSVLIVNLGGGNDHGALSLTSGSDNLLIVNGGAGLDNLSIVRAGDSMIWMKAAESTVLLTPIDQTPGTQTLLQDVERLQFTDGRVAFDIDGTNGAGAAYRIYQAAFDRTPDIGGLTFWTEQADKGMSTIEMSARFIDSNEFRQLYGSSNLPAATFVDQVYENVLHRAGEQGGVDYWVGQINSGMSEAEVLARFADSAENRGDVIGIIGNGIWLNPEGDYA